MRRTPDASHHTRHDNEEKPMHKLTRTAAALTALTTAGVMLTGCSEDADVASKNLSKAADNFEILRRVVFYNGISGDYILAIEGYCSIGNSDGGGKVTVTCKTGKKQYKKHFLGLSDNVTYFAEQLESADVSVNHYRVTFKPQELIPDIDVRGGTDDLPRAQD